jgi:GGDEF domain-containing protein
LPADILLPLFVLTLLANAFLVATAIRGMRRSQADRARPIETGRPSRVQTPVVAAPHLAAAPPVSGPASRVEARPMTDELARAIAARRTPPPRQPLVPTATEAAPPTDPEPPGEQIEPANDSGGGSGDVQTAPIPAPKRRRTTKKSAPPADPGGSRPTESRSAEARRGRRRFALPPLDDDHERVSRSIETFLGGVETVETDMPPDAADESSGGPATVAIVAVDELPHGAAADEAVTDALAMVERTLRGAVRGTDVVTTGGRGRFRIVLPSTGEFAARAYVRRIRATIEPRLVAADRPLRLVVATATVLDEPLEDAVRRAEHRLSAALRDAGPPAGEPEADRGIGTVDEPTVPRAATD